MSELDIVGKLATEVYQTDSAPYLDIYAKVAITGESYEFTTYYPPMDKHFRISVVSPSENHFATITADITAMKHAQDEILYKSKELENYLYVASHDLRSPLVNIQGFSQRMQKQYSALKAFSEKLIVETELREKIDKLTNEEMPRTIDFIQTNVTKMNNLIDSLLQISRTGRMPLEIKKLDMNVLFSNVINSYNFELTELGAMIETEDLPPCYGDENQLNQVFSNIIGNALKYRSPDTKPEIKISTKQTYNRIIYCISDNGKGMAERHLKKIWDVFYRIDPLASEAGEGIGLSIAKTIVTKHKGRVWVESEENKGTTFYIELLKNNFSEL
jgi:signal transduction histidine kinase